MASMYFQYGSYAHPPGEVQVNSFDRASQFAETGQLLSVTHTMSLSGIIIPTAAQIAAAGSSAAAIDRRVREIQDAYALNGLSASLKFPNGTDTGLRLDSGLSLYGVQITSGPSFPMERNQAHFATSLPYSITLKAEFGAATVNASSYFLGASETIQQTGDGGPITTITLLDNGPPVIDIVRPSSPVFVTQTGDATYELSFNLPPVYPDYAPYLFPDNLIRPDGIRLSRRKTRPKLGGKVQYISSWSYSYQFTSPPFITNPSV